MGTSVLKTVEVTKQIRAILDTTLQTEIWSMVDNPWDDTLTVQLGSVQYIINTHNFDALAFAKFVKRYICPQLVIPDDLQVSYAARFNT